MNRRDFLMQSMIAGLAGRKEAISRPIPPTRGPGAGFAERDITPEIGMEVPGGYGKSFSRKVHDPCKVRAAVFDDGQRLAVLVGADAGSIPRSLVLKVREEIHEKLGIPPDAVMIGAAHSHSSGPIGGIERGEYDHASAFVQQLAYEKSTVDDPKYVDYVCKQLIDAISSAIETRTKAYCGAAFGYEEKAAYNRRFRMSNGLAYTHPGQGNPEILEVAGPIDPEVGVIGVWDAKGKLQGCIVNYACHATTNPGGISANWIYYLEKVIRGAFGPDVVVVFFQGNSGDVTQVDNLSPYQRPDGEREAWYFGGRVGAEAVKALLTIYPGELVPVTAESEILAIQRRLPSPERVRQSLEIARKDPAHAGHTEWTFAKEILMLDAKLQVEPVPEVEVQAIQVGPAVLVSTPGELFCSLGLEIKAGSPFPFTFPVSLANGAIGYVPTEEAFGPHGGGYETRLTGYSNLEIAAAAKLVGTGLTLTRRMSPGQVPKTRDSASIPEAARWDRIGTLVLWKRSSGTQMRSRD